jgi:hypothetical protein
VVDTAAGVLHDVKQHAMTIAAMIAMITNATRCAGLFVDVFEFFDFIMIDVLICSLRVVESNGGIPICGVTGGQPTTQTRE